MLNVKQAKAVLVFAFAPSLSLKAIDSIAQPTIFGGAVLIAQPRNIGGNNFNIFKKEGHSHTTEEEEGHPLHDDEENDTCGLLRNQLFARKRSRREQ